MIMNEDFLQYLWKFRLLHGELNTVGGDRLVVLHPGEHNSNSGPDFCNARIRIAETLWAGNVEIHVNASDWFRHGHQQDRAYDNVILHVVYHHDADIPDTSNEYLPVLEIKGQFDESLFSRYEYLMMNQLWIPCVIQLDPSCREVFRIWSPALAVERLVQKSSEIRRLWDSTGQDWEESFYQHIAVGFGFKINGFPFEMLAKSLPLRLVRKHCNNLFQVESMFFGQAGMLDHTWQDDYPRKLEAEYAFFRAKHRLTSMSGGMWKFLRLRPSNFPTIRISQFANFLQKTGCRFFWMTEQALCKESRVMFNVGTSGYWDNHFLFDKDSVLRPKVMGQRSSDLLIINVLVPFMFFYGTMKGDARLREKALEMLEELVAEENSETRRWNNAGLSSKNALESQALIQLKRGYCNHKQCLRCRIGDSMLQRKR
jgi:hypothetical protein